MDESQNNTNNNDLNLVPPEENPLQEAPYADDQSGAIGDALNPNNFSSDSDPLLSGTTSSEPAEPIAPPIATEEKPTKTKIKNKGLLIGIGITALNLIICAVAIIICANISNKPAESTPDTATKTDDFPNSLQCEVNDCLANIKLDSTLDQITNYLGIKPEESSSAKYVLSDNVTLNVRVGSYPDFSLDFKDKTKLKDSKFTNEQYQEIRAHAYTYKGDSNWTRKDVEKLIGKGTLTGRSNSYTSYTWFNQSDKTYFTLSFNVDGDTYYSPLSTPNSF
jgi:hypothetical protein